MHSTAATETGAEIQECENQTKKQADSNESHGLNTFTLLLALVSGHDVVQLLEQFCIC